MRSGFARNRYSESEAVLRFAAQAHAAGVAVDWQAVYSPLHPKRVDLPTYPFERRRFWFDGVAVGAGDLASVGLSGIDHPFLGAAVRVGDDQGWLFSGRVSRDAFPWLADHAVGGLTVLPGAAVVDMALAAGGYAGVGWLDELLLHAPLMIPEHDAVALQLVIGPAAPDGRCEMRLFSRRSGATGEDRDVDARAWVRHASGVLRPSTDVTPTTVDPLTEWPPVDAVAAEIDSLYDGLADAGLFYGPAFQGVRSVWQRGEEVFAEVALEEGRRRENFALHPVLLDAALHAAAALLDDDLDSHQVKLPFAWTGVGLLTAPAAEVSVLRVALRRQRIRDHTPCRRRIGNPAAAGATAGGARGGYRGTGTPGQRR